MDTEYVNRLLGHLTNRENFCNSCNDECINCRKKYDLDFSENISGIIGFPSVLPCILEEPEEFLPDSIPDHDILLAISVNEEILISFINKFPLSKGVIIPIEDGKWISPYGKRKISEICNKHNIEIDFPKPFCTLSPQGGRLLKFQHKFKIGKPEIKFNNYDKNISNLKVITSAPCGATYYTASCLLRADFDDNLKFVIEKSLSCYPCTASRLFDKDFNDSIMHQAVKTQRDILNNLEIQKEEN